MSGGVITAEQSQRKLPSEVSRTMAGASARPQGERWLTRLPDGERRLGRDQLDARVFDVAEEAVTSLGDELAEGRPRLACAGHPLARVFAYRAWDQRCLICRVTYNRPVAQGTASRRSRRLAGSRRWRAPPASGAGAH